MTIQTTDWRGAGVALICGSLILLISLGVRHTFGLFLQPVSMDQGWGRETFAFSIALQNLVWGASQPFAGMLADRYGAKPVVAVGAVLYGLGLWLMSIVGGEALFILGAGVVIGLGLSGTTFPVIFGAISRLVRPEQRSLAMGITMSVGSFGQFAMLPISLGLIVELEWQGALIALSVLALMMFPLAFGIRNVPAPVASAVEDVSFGRALRDAFGERDFWLLSLGFFACGFQVVFIAVHLPAYLADNGIGSGTATIVLALIGLVNIGGTYFAGLWGGRHRKPMLLSWIYLGRALAIAAFVLLPLSQASAYVFGAVMGLFWLSTVPLTNGTVATVFGVKHMSMLGGIVFFAHQLGSFAGGWLGGWLYDRTGNYDAAWGIAIGLSLVSVLLNWPITERTLAERRAA
ncbi:MFS transporter [Tropicimonas isoalkanivorans]|uniref:Predicted arabinose efflux permease, MFS family n=1 Tax=Tropicimonas isoalkanivorans TaxID=441112 RepID=A0A1I1QAV4_9RHOB|nr:MFS transporter [Tropicimonas isoalkanivorans]SFD15270.1 Predicted arabinose efflux permease, MFS family [Tropicimonas isoalkanivorans]